MREAIPSEDAQPARDGTLYFSSIPCAAGPRRALAIAASVALLAAVCIAACSKAAPGGKFQQKLVILGFDGMDPALVTRWMAAGQLPNIARLAVAGRRLPARHDAVARVADGVGVVRHRREPGQAQHLRLPRARHEHLPAGSRHGPARAAALPVRLLPDRAKPKVLSIRGGTSFWVTAGQRRRALEHAHRPGDVPARGRPERRAARRPAPARHPRHDGDLLLLRDRL